jgi:hypothetical protein
MLVTTSGRHSETRPTAKNIAHPVLADRQTVTGISDTYRDVFSQHGAGQWIIHGFAAQTAVNRSGHADTSDFALCIDTAKNRSSQNKQ